MKPLLSSSTLLARLSGLGQWSSRSSALLVPTASALAMTPLPASRRSQVVVRVRPKGRGGQGGPGPGGYRRFDDDDGQDPRKEGGNGRGGILGMWQRMGMGRYLVVGWVGFTGIYYYTHLDQVPISGRRRFLAISPEDEEFMARSSLQQVLQQYSAKILPSYHPVHQFVAGVVKRLLPVTGLQNLEWEIRVIADPQKVGNWSSRESCPSVLIQTFEPLSERLCAPRRQDLCVYRTFGDLPRRRLAGYSSWSRNGAHDRSPLFGKAFVRPAVYLVFAGGTLRSRDRFDLGPGADLQLCRQLAAKSDGGERGGLHWVGCSTEAWLSR